MKLYEFPAAIEQAIATFRGRHPDTDLYLSRIDYGSGNDNGYSIKLVDPESGFKSHIFIPAILYREYDGYETLEVDLIRIFEAAYDEMNDILEGKTCTETVN